MPEQVSAIRNQPPPRPRIRPDRSPNIRHRHGVIASAAWQSRAAPPDDGTGHVTKLFIELPSGEELVSTQLTRGSISEIPTGGTVRLGWPRDRTVALRHTPETGP